MKHVLRTLANGVRVVEALAEEAMPLRRLTTAVGLPRQTTYRLVQTLIALGWVERRADDVYALTARLWGLGVSSFASADLRDRMAGTVRSLAREHGETVHLAIYERGEVIYVDKADGSHPIRAYTSVGGRAPARCVATGKLLLAHQDAAERARVLTQPATAFTERTIVDEDAMIAELDAIRGCGYAVNAGEWRPGVGGVAVAVHACPGEVVGALGFSGPIDRLEQHRDALLAGLRAAVEQALPGAEEASAVAP